MSTRQTNKMRVSFSIINQAKRTYDAVNRIPQWASATFNKTRRESKKKLLDLYGIHKGKRCFIIGNGPSLKSTDLGKLKAEFTISTNRFYLAFQEIGFSTSYYLTVNNLIAEQSGNAIQELNLPKFVSWRMRKWIKPDPLTYYLYTTYTGKAFSSNVSNRVWEGGTVTYVALQLAFHLGFDEVILIGVDHNYSTKGKPNLTVTSEKEDRDHFLPNYFGPGYRWQLPDLDNWVFSYELAKEFYNNAGRRILDATVGGKLTVYPKVDYDSLF